jgi:hypothetical protein
MSVNFEPQACAIAELHIKPTDVDMPSCFVRTEHPSACQFCGLAAQRLREYQGTDTPFQLGIGPFAGELLAGPRGSGSTWLMGNVIRC